MSRRQKNTYQIYILQSFSFYANSSNVPNAFVDQLIYSNSFSVKVFKKKKQTIKMCKKKKKDFDEKGTMKKDYGQDSKSFSSVVNGHSLQPSFDMRVRFLDVLLLLVILFCVQHFSHFSSLAN